MPTAAYVHLPTSSFAVFNDLLRQNARLSGYCSDMMFHRHGCQEKALFQHATSRWFSGRCYSIYRDVRANQNTVTNLTELWASDGVQYVPFISAKQPKSRDGRGWASLIAVWFVRRHATSRGRRQSADWPRDNEQSTVTSRVAWQLRRYLAVWQRVMALPCHVNCFVASSSAC